MENKKESKIENKKISFRNYLLVIIVSIITITIALYLRAFYINYNDKITDSSILENEISEVNLNELRYTISESGEVILYVSYTGDIEVYEMEKKLLKEINKKSLNDKVLYLNVSDSMLKNEYLSILKSQFSNISTQINNVPMFIYIENGEAKEAFSSELKMVDYKVFNEIVEKYEIE